VYPSHKNTNQKNSNLNLITIGNSIITNTSIKPFKNTRKSNNETYNKNNMNKNPLMKHWESPSRLEKWEREVVEHTSVARIELQLVMLDFGMHESVLIIK
jgi:hypothetical protein